MSEESSSDVSDGWISWLCGLKGNEFLCKVDKEFIVDGFNTYGLDKQIIHYRRVMDIILDQVISDQGPYENRHTQYLIEKEAELLYGLIHARYITTYEGMVRMREKYSTKVFGTCRRVYCENAHFLPIGLTDNTGEEKVKLYCPKCKDIYEPRPKIPVDGAFFGTSFPHLFFLTFPFLRPKEPEKFIPRLYGFKIHPSAYEIQAKAVAEKPPTTPK